MLDCNGAKSFHRLLVDVHNCSLQLREFVTVKNRGPEGIAHKDHDLGFFANPRSKEPEVYYAAVRYVEV